jgi:hypothetical protein
MFPRAERAAVAILCAGLASSALAACGGSGSGADNPSSSPSPTANDLVKFARCMREHGVQLETPTSGHVDLIRGGAGVAPRALEAARRACQKYTPPAAKRQLTPAEKVAGEEAVQKFAKCMREHGSKVETHARNGNTGVRIGGPGANLESPALQKAMKACQGLNPKGPVPLRTREGPRG